jgi:hypothetical protein
MLQCNKTNYLLVFTRYLQNCTAVSQSAYLITQTAGHISIKFSIDCLQYRLLDEINFGPYRSNTYNNIDRKTSKKRATTKA